jgi:hypothetical protein
MNPWWMGTIFLSTHYPQINMSMEGRPACIGLFSDDVECCECEWRLECQKMMDGIESQVYRKGTHMRLTGKYKEKKYKPKRVP